MGYEGIYWKCWKYSFKKKNCKGTERMVLEVTGGRWVRVKDTKGRPGEGQSDKNKVWDG